jgi:hypothetical protein
MEGSSYSGYLVSDQIYFGNEWHFGHSAISFTFACVEKETNYFYSQAADGILGMGMDASPIYEAMKT